MVRVCLIGISDKANQLSWFVPSLQTNIMAVEDVEAKRSTVELFLFQDFCGHIATSQDKLDHALRGNKRTSLFKTLTTLGPVAGSFLV